MATEQDRKNFAAEFEALKAKYGEAFSDLRAVRFYGEADEKIRTEREFVPYFCRLGNDGLVHCEKERPV